MEQDKPLPSWYVYIIRASDQSLYTGITTDPERRFAEHQSGKAGAKYFRGVGRKDGEGDPVSDWNFPHPPCHYALGSVTF